MGDPGLTRRPALIIVSGHPATGKTTFARKLSSAIGVPLFAKDDLKERLHETFGAADREASRRLGQASYSMLEHTSDVMLAAGQDLVIESNFDSDGAGGWIEELGARHSALLIQVFLHADPDVILQRYTERSERRHAAHFDEIAVDELRARLKRPYRPMDLSGHALEFDTTDFRSFDADRAIDAVADLLAERADS